MKIVQARNVHQALPKGLALLKQHGVERSSRNGAVRVAPWPVVTEYERPLERVCFWPDRDANPAFSLFESLWMLAGRRDLEPLLRYVGDFSKFSDDGQVLNGAYGYRWRHALGEDQLVTIAQRLKENPDDRRSVLQMWQGEYDLGSSSKDVPCNLMVSFQRQADGALDMTVFCRSNDIIWGAYGANAVHFGFLLEYLALAIGCPVGVYRQISVNWHAYADLYAKLEDLPRKAWKGLFMQPQNCIDPYAQGMVRVVPLGDAGDDITEVDRDIETLLMHADTGFQLLGEGASRLDMTPFFHMAVRVLRAHEVWRQGTAPERFTQALAVLTTADPTADWVVAMQEWLLRRQAKWEAKLMRQTAGA